MRRVAVLIAAVVCLTTACTSGRDDGPAPTSDPSVAGERLTVHVHGVSDGTTAVPLPRFPAGVAVTVSAADGAGAGRTAMTDGTGVVSFPLVAGDYQVASVCGEMPQLIAVGEGGTSTVDIACHIS